MEANIITIIGLAIVNALNPCALGALVMVLFSILIANENKRHRVLLGGLYFTLAVFIGYFIYGIIIINIFRTFAQFASVVYPYIKIILGIIAIVIGIFQLKDYFNYKPGSFGTEMPLKFRPIVKQITKRISTPSGAFLVGIFVTLFLLPCTIAPYIVAIGSLSSLSFFQQLSYILLYNLIFVLPMIVITLVITFGFTTTEKVSEWRERKIRVIHLIAGLILTALGIAMVTGLI